MAFTLLAGGIAYSVLGGRPRQRELSDAAQERAILAAFDEMKAAAERLDADGLFRYVRDNQRGALVSAGRIFLTREEALAETRRGFEGVAALKYKFGQRHVTLLSPDTALVVASVTSEVTANDGRTFSLPFVQSVVLTRDKDGWRVLHTHQSTPTRSR